MRITISGSESPLGRALMAGLRGEHHLSTLAVDPRDDAAVPAVMDGVEALIHLDPISVPARGASDPEILDRSARGTYVLLRAAVAAGVRRVVVGSTLSLLERYPASWTVDEQWQPLPDVTDVRQLAAHLAEQSARQFVFFEPVEIVCLRFGEIVEQTTATRGRDWTWLHVEDAATAVQQALSAPLHLNVDEGRPSQRLGHGWRVYHISGAGHTRFPQTEAAAALGYRPVHDLAPGLPPQPGDAERSGDLSLPGPAHRAPFRPIRRVVVFGAGGPLAAATAQVLAPSYQLRLTDVRPIADIAAAGVPQSPGAPLPQLLPPPHEEMQTDITDPAQVLRASQGMDAIINCTVVRHDLEQAFRVNCLGVYNVMRAAVANGIRRVVHTGPLQVSSEWPSGYAWDFDVPDESPGRSGGWLYGHSKLLGQELVRLFAETYDLEAPALYFSIFVNPLTARPRSGGVHAMTVTWEDAAHAMRRALEIPTLPSPFEIFHILTNLPHGKYSSSKAQRLLGWRPRDDLHHLWARRAGIMPRGDQD